MGRDVAGESGRTMVPAAGAGTSCRRSPHPGKEPGLRFKPGAAGTPRHRTWHQRARQVRAGTGIVPALLQRPTVPAQSAARKDALEHQPDPAKSPQTRGVVTRNISPVTSQAVTDVCQRDTGTAWRALGAHWGSRCPVPGAGLGAAARLSRLPGAAALPGSLFSLVGPPRDHLNTDKYTEITTRLQYPG